MNATSFLIGLLTLPAAAAAGLLLHLAYQAITCRIQLLDPANPHRRAKVAGRMFACKRAWVLTLRRTTIAVAVGNDHLTAQPAYALLMDHFHPATEEETADDRR